MMYPKIYAEMERYGLTIHQLAAVLGLPLNEFILRLSGGSEFTLYEIECLADLFGCSLDYLVEHMENQVRHRSFMRLYSAAQLLT